MTDHRSRPTMTRRLRGLARYQPGPPSLLFAWLFSAIAVVGLIHSLFVGSAVAIDFGVYWRTAREPLSLIYTPHATYPFPYAPTMLLWIAPLALLPLWVGYLGWVSASAVALFMMCRRHLTFGQSWLVVLSPPLTSGLMAGQVAALLAAALLWAMGTSNRVAAGITLGLCATVKPQLVLLAPLLLLLRQDWLALAASAATFIAVIGLAVALYGGQPWFDWVSSMPYFRAVLRGSNIIELIATPTGFAERFDLWALPFWMAGAILGLLLVWACRRAGPLESTAAIAAGSILCSPYALTYDLAPVVPFLVAAIYAGRLTAAAAMSGILHPMPILLTAWELGQSAKVSSKTE